MAERVALILAAGAGSRMGGRPKALLELSGQSFLASIVELARAHQLEPVVVTGAYREAVEAAARLLDVMTVFNAQHAVAGMASSLQAGLMSGPMSTPTLTGALLWPVDHPAVAAATLVALMDASAPGRIVVPTSAGRGGHPVWFGRDFWPELRDPALDSRGGARAVLRTHPAHVIRVIVDDPGVHCDVDTPADYAKIAARTAKELG